MPEPFAILNLDSSLGSGFTSNAGAFLTYLLLMFMTDLAFTTWFFFLSRQHDIADIHIKKMGYDNRAQYDQVRSFGKRLYSGPPSRASLEDAKAIFRLPNSRAKQWCMMQVMKRLFPPPLEDEKYDIVRPLCYDRDPNVRSALVISLGQKSNPAATRMLQQLTNDSDPNVRDLALKTMANAREPKK